MCSNGGYANQGDSMVLLFSFSMLGQCGSIPSKSPDLVLVVVIIVIIVVVIIIAAILAYIFLPKIGETILKTKL